MRAQSIVFSRVFYECNEEPERRSWPRRHRAPAEQQEVINLLLKIVPCIYCIYFLNLIYLSNLKKFTKKKIILNFI